MGKRARHPQRPAWFRRPARLHRSLRLRRELDRDPRLLFPRARGISFLATRHRPRTAAALRRRHRVPGGSGGRDHHGLFLPATRIRLQSASHGRELPRGNRGEPGERGQGLDPTLRLFPAHHRDRIHLRSGQPGLDRGNHLSRRGRANLGPHAVQGVRRPGLVLHGNRQRAARAGQLDRVRRQSAPLPRDGGSRNGAPILGQRDRRAILPVSVVQGRISAAGSDVGEPRVPLPRRRRRRHLHRHRDQPRGRGNQQPRPARRHVGSAPDGRKHASLRDSTRQPDGAVRFQRDLHRERERLARPGHRLVPQRPHLQRLDRILAHAGGGQQQ